MSRGAYTVASEIAAALVADATLTAYCTTTFTRQPRIYVGIDKQKVPSNDNYPYIAVMPGSVTLDPTQAMRMVTVDIALVLQDERVSDDGRTVTMLGLSIAEAFWFQVETVLKTYATTKYLDSWQIAAATHADEFPDYDVVAQITVQEDGP